MVINGNFGPWRPDQPALDNTGVVTARNVTPGFGNAPGSVTYYPMRRADLYSATTMGSRPLGAVSAQDVFKNAKIYGGDAGNLYKMDPATRSWTPCGKTGGYTTTAGEQWSFTEFGSLIIASNFSDNPQYIDKTTDIQFADLTTLTRGRHMAIVRDFLVMGNTFDALDGEVPYRVRWSAFGNPFDWSFSLQTQADFQDIFNGGAVQAIVGGEAGWILLQNAIVKMTYIGAPLVFQFDEIVTGKGCSVSESVITVEGKTFFLSEDGFYVLQGDQIAPIGAGKVDNYFLENADPSQFDKMTVAADPAEKLVYWLYASRDAVDAEPDMMIIYNYQTGEWSEASSATSYIFNALTLPWTLEQLDAFGTLEDVPASLDSPNWTGGVSVLWSMKPNGSIYMYGGAKKRGTIETQEMFYGQQLQAQDPRFGDVTFLRGVRPLVHGDGALSVAAIYRDLPTDTTSETPNVLISTTTGYAYFRHASRLHRFRIVLDGDWTSAMGYEADITPTGIR